MKRYKILSIIVLFGIMVNSNLLLGQDQIYYPKGDPGQLNVEINPFLWLPAIKGQVSTERASEEVTTPAVDLLSNLRFAFMLNAEVSKGKFFASPSYIYAKLGSEEILKTDKNGDPAIVSYPGLKMNIFEFLAGMRFDFDQKFYLDPYLGFRYTSYNIEGKIEGVRDTTEFQEKADYWDPVLGLRMHYYPHPRVPLTLKTDIGGFGAGSKLSWTTAFNVGYSVSPTVDLVAGIIAYGSDFEKENELGNKVGLDVIMYGFDLGVRIMIPAKYKDPAIFKKGKK